MIVRSILRIEEVFRRIRSRSKWLYLLCDCIAVRAGIRLDVENIKYGNDDLW
jgi:hypothetical protein